jgi:hypothetical protein
MKNMFSADPQSVPSAIDEAMSMLPPEAKISVALHQLLKKANQVSEIHEFMIDPTFDAMQDWRANYEAHVQSHGKETVLTHYVQQILHIVEPTTPDGQRKDCRAINHTLYNFVVENNDSISGALRVWGSTKNVERQNNL